MRAPILEHMTAVADPVRCRMLRLLERNELTVSELCAILQLPQSTVSRHLKTLADDAWIGSRRDGTSRFYSMRSEDLADDARRLWELVREQIAGSAAQQDETRLRSALGRRRSRSLEFFSSAAGQWDRLRADLFGEGFHLHALLGLIDSSWVVGDLGCGTGQLSQVLSPFVSRVIAVDGSPEMLQAARRRLASCENVDLRAGELEALPIQEGALDAAILMLVLHYVAEPGRALAEAARVLRPGGRLLVVDMSPHDRDEYQKRMGHVWLGFSDKQIARYLGGAGFETVAVRALPPDAGAKGPSLFVASAQRSATSKRSRSENVKTA